MASDAGICFQLCQGTVQKVCYPLRRCFDLQSGAQRLILRSDTDRTFTGTADTILLAGCRNQSGRCYCNGIRTHGQSLGKIGRYPQPAGNHQRNIISSHSIKILSGTIQSINGRNTGRITNQLRTGTCSAAASVDRNKIRLCKNAKLQITFQLTGCDLDTDRPAVRLLAQLRHQCFQILFCIDIRELRRADNIFSQRFIPDRRDFRCHFAAGKMSAHTGLRTLADLDLDRIGITQIFPGHTV